MQIEPVAFSEITKQGWGLIIIACALLIGMFIGFSEKKKKGALK